MQRDAEVALPPLGRGRAPQSIAGASTDASPTAPSPTEPSGAGGQVEPRGEQVPRQQNSEAAHSQELEGHPAMKTSKTERTHARKEILTGFGGR